jgi:thiamine pyrophosphokinase
MHTVLLASGEYPRHETPLRLLAEAERIVCCDGAVNELCAHGLTPDWVVGDLDSISDELRLRFSDRVMCDPSQDDNDLSKAFRFCVKRGWRDLVILGAGGKREDHLLGNIALLADFTAEARVSMVTNYGVFRAFVESPVVLDATPGQQISMFSCDAETRVSGSGFKFPLENLQLRRWWTATLNEAVAPSPGLDFTRGPLVVFQAFERA